MPDKPKLQFRATIPDIQGALKFGSKIGRFTLEVPESDVPEAIGMIALQGIGLKITVEIDDGSTTESDNQEGGETEGAGQGSGKGQGRPWLRKAGKANPATG